MKRGKKRYKAWCYGCDRAMVAGGKKCPVCGQRMPDKKDKTNKVVKNW